MIKNIFNKFLGKRRHINGHDKKINNDFEFNNAMDFIGEVLEYERELEDKTIIIDYILNIIREDIKTDLLTTIIYSEANFEKEIDFPFPYEFYDNLGNKIKTRPEKTTERKVNLSKDCVLVLSWDRERLRNSIKNIYKSEFEYHASNHLAYYFTHIDVCYVYNGTHSISSGIGHKKGFIKAKEYDISRLFDHLYTDGMAWYSVHDNNKLGEIFDFRIAILYELAKIKYNLLK